MENWMQKFEKRKDDSREKELNQILKELLIELARSEDELERIIILEKIVCIYDTLKLELFDYDDKDYLDKKKELAFLRYKKMQREHRYNDESKSWNEYQEEEMKNDGIEEER